MPIKTKAGLVGAIVVVVILGLQSVEHWTVVDAVIVGLREAGPFGAFVATVLMSPILPLVLALTAIYLVFEGRNGRKEPASSSPQIENRAENNPSQSLNQTGAKFETHYHATPPPVLPPSPSPKPPAPPPNLQYRRVFLDKVFVGHELTGHSHNAWIAEIGNELTDRDIGIAENIRGHITYLDENGKVLQILCPAGWDTYQPTHSVDIPCGQGRMLILATYDMGRWVSDLFNGLPIREYAKLEVRLIDLNGKHVLDEILIFELRNKAGVMTCTKI